MSPLSRLRLRPSDQSSQTIENGDNAFLQQGKAVFQYLVRQIGDEAAKQLPRFARNEGGQQVKDEEDDQQAATAFDEPDQWTSITCPALKRTACPTYHARNKPQQKKRQTSEDKQTGQPTQWDIGR